jgi:hypothetical protein
MAIRVTGIVERLYVRAERTNIRLVIPAQQQPLDGYFALEMDHPNYYSLYSLALSAAINRYPLQIRTKAEITPDEPAVVEYLVVDW